MKQLSFAVAFLLLAGCGGSSARFGSNSKVEVVLFSNSIEDLSLIVSPNEQDWDSPNACRENNDGFGCSQELFNDATAYYFTTNSSASERPFHVYVDNPTNRSVRYRLQIFMDDDGEASLDTGWYDIPPDTVWFEARIFRNNAGYPDWGREKRELTGEQKAQVRRMGQAVQRPDRALGEPRSK